MCIHPPFLAMCTHAHAGKRRVSCKSLLRKTCMAPAQMSHSLELSVQKRPQRGQSCTSFHMEPVPLSVHVQLKPGSPSVTLIKTSRKALPRASEVDQ